MKNQSNQDTVTNIDLSSKKPKQFFLHTCLQTNDDKFYAANVNESDWVGGFCTADRNSKLSNFSDFPVQDTGMNQFKFTQQELIEILMFSSHFVWIRFMKNSLFLLKSRELRDTAHSNL